MTTAGSEADDAPLLPDVGLKPPIGVAGLGDSAFDFVDVVLTRESAFQEFVGFHEGLQGRVGNR